MTLKVLFVGGTGQISLSCVEAAVAAGHQVTVFNRGTTRNGLPPGVVEVIGSFVDHDRYRAAAHAAYDVVCQFIAYTPDDVSRDLDIFRGHVGQYIFISSASAYRKPVNIWPITEDVPLVNPHWAYSALKAAAEAVLTDQDDLPYTIVRPSHTVRTHLPTAFGERDIAATRLLRGLPVVVPGDGTSLWTLTRSADFAIPFVGLFGRDGALGEAFNLTSDHAFAWNQIYRAIGAALGVEADIVHVPSDTLIRFRPEWEGPLFGDKMHSALFDNAKIKAVVGDFACAPTLAEILAEPIAHFRRSAGEMPPDETGIDALFDRIIAAQRAIGPLA